MPQEKIFSDWSGGMNASVAVDKIDDKECLLAENCRFDEQGNVQIAGCLALQQSGLTDGTSTKVHSLFVSNGIQALAGVGKDLWGGADFSNLTDILAGSNTNSQKIAFASAIGKIYFDLSNVGYFLDQTGQPPLLVDYAPPLSGGSLTGPNLAGTGVDKGSSWTTPNNVTDTSSSIGTSARILLSTGGSFISSQLQGTNFGFAVGGGTVIAGVKVTFTCDVLPSLPATATVVASLLKAGIPTGNTKTVNVDFSGGFRNYTLGSVVDSWGLPLLGADVNLSTFGVQLSVHLTGVPFSGAAIGVSNLKIQVGAAGSGTIAGTGAAGALIGTYTWKLTNVAFSGEESDSSSPTQSVVLASQMGSLTSIPPGDARTGSRNVYRKGVALTSYYLVGSLNDNTTTTFADNVTDLSALTTGVILAGDTPGDLPNTRLGTQIVRFPELHYDRVFWIVPSTNQVIWSKPLNGFAYPTTNSINVGDSKPCWRLVSIFGELIIVKADGLWRLTGTDESTFQLTRTPSAVGTDEPFSICALPDKILFRNSRGFWAFNGYTSVKHSQKLEAWFLQQDRTGVSEFGINGFHVPEISNRTVAALTDAVENSTYMLVGYADSGVTVNNVALKINIETGQIQTRTSTNGGGFPSVAADEVLGLFYFGDLKGNVWLLDSPQALSDSPVNVDFQTKYYVPQRGSNVAMWAVEFFIFTNGLSVTPTVYYDNGKSSETLTAISTTTMARVLRPLNGKDGRKAQNISVRLNLNTSTINTTSTDGLPAVQLNHIKLYYDVRSGRARTGQ